MSRAPLLAVVLLVLGAGSAQANPGPLLTGPDARSAIAQWSLAHGMVEVEVRRCMRHAPAKIRCVAAETGWLNEEGGLWAEGVPSWFMAERRPSRVTVTWLDFVWGSACTTAPGLEPQCPSG